MPRSSDENHHLYKNGNCWSVRIVLPKNLGGGRKEYSTGTADVRIARRIRDRILTSLLEEQTAAEMARQLLNVAVQADQTAQALVQAAHAELAVARPSGPSLVVSCQRFIENRRDFKRRSPGMVADYQESLAALQAVLGNPSLRDVTSKDVRAFRDRMLVVRRFWNRKGQADIGPVAEADRLHPSTVIKIMKNISTFFAWAVREELMDRNPVLSVDLPTKPRHHTPAPDAALADRLCTVPPPRSRIVGQLEWEVLPWFFRYTGARLGEIIELTSDGIMLEHGVRCLRIRTEKTTMRAASRQGDPVRLVPIHPRLEPFLQRVLDQRQNGRLFPLAGDRWDLQLQAIRLGYEWSRLYNRHVKTIWPDMHVHCWRAYAVTEMARAGIAEEVRMRVVGHATRSVHQGYNQVDLSRLKDAVWAIP